MEIKPADIKVQSRNESETDPLNPVSIVVQTSLSEIPPSGKMTLQNREISYIENTPESRSCWVALGEQLGWIKHLKLGDKTVRIWSRAYDLIAKERPKASDIQEVASSQGKGDDTNRQETPTFERKVRVGVDSNPVGVQFWQQVIQKRFRDLQSIYCEALSKISTGELIEGAGELQQEVDSAISVIVNDLAMLYSISQSKRVERLINVCVMVVDRLEPHQMEAFITKMESLSIALGKFYEETLKPGKSFALEEFISILEKHFSQEEMGKVRKILGGEESSGWFDLST